MKFYNSKSQDCINYEYWLQKLSNKLPWQKYNCRRHNCPYHGNKVRAARTYDIAAKVPDMPYVFDWVIYINCSLLPEQVKEIINCILDICRNHTESELVLLRPARKNGRYHFHLLFFSQQQPDEELLLTKIKGAHKLFGIYQYSETNKMQKKNHPKRWMQYIAKIYHHSHNPESVPVGSGIRLWYRRAKIKRNKE